MTFLVRTFIDTSTKMKDPDTRAVLDQLLALYLSYELIQSAAGLLEVSNH